MKQPLNRVKRQKSQSTNPFLTDWDRMVRTLTYCSPYQDPPKTEFKIAESMLSQKQGPQSQKLRLQVNYQETEANNICE